MIVAIRLSLVFVLTVHSSSPAMSVANNEAQSSSDTPPFRQGALDAAEIRGECPQFRVLVIGKANAGKTTILRKVCNAKPDAKPVIYDAEGKRVKQDSTKVGLENLMISLGANWQVIQLFSLTKVLRRIVGHSADVLNPSTEVRQTKTCLIISDDFVAWRPQHWISDHLPWQ